VCDVVSRIKWRMAGLDLAHGRPRQQAEHPEAADEVDGCGAACGPSESAHVRWCSAIMLEDRWVQCEADAAAIAVYVDIPGIVAAILEEHENKPPFTNSAIVPLTQGADGEPSTYYGQFGILQTAAESVP
jgi:hypothetical protein